MVRVPVAEGVFTWPSDEPRLIGNTDGGLIANGAPQVGYTQLDGAPGVAGVSTLSA